MNNPDLYQRSNGLQMQDAFQILEDYHDRIDWNGFGGNIIDIGSGDGGVTSNVLKNFMPKNYEKIIGCDISQDMTRYANKHHGTEKIKFIMCDIESNLPQYLQGSFDHAFSFYALQWIRNQRLAFTNIYNLLTEDGDCLLMFSKSSPIFDAYRILACTKKWSYWLRDVEQYVAPYQDSLEPEKKITEMMEAIGFKTVEVTVRKRSYMFRNIHALRNFVAAVNGFDLPPDIYEDYLNDFMTLVEAGVVKDMVTSQIGDQLGIKCDYSILVVYARKKRSHYKY